jgi:hypothetical protein
MGGGVLHPETGVPPCSLALGRTICAEDSSEMWDPRFSGDSRHPGSIQPLAESAQGMHFHPVLMEQLACKSDRLLNPGSKMPISPDLPLMEGDSQGWETLGSGC